MRGNAERVHGLLWAHLYEDQTQSTGSATSDASWPENVGNGHFFSSVHTSFACSANIYTREVLFVSRGILSS